MVNESVKMEISVHVMIAGRVQGVGYRAWCVNQAKDRGLRGWVRNRRDGTVEAVFAGEAGRVESMVAACEEGPTSARVENVESREWQQDAPQDFTARETV